MPTKVKLRNKETGEIIPIAENGDVKLDGLKAVESSVKKPYISKKNFNNVYHELAVLNLKL